MKVITRVGFLPPQPSLSYIMITGPERIVLAKNAPENAPFMVTRFTVFLTGTTGVTGGLPLEVAQSHPDGDSCELLWFRQLVGCHTRAVYRLRRRNRPVLLHDHGGSRSLASPR